MPLDAVHVIHPFSVVTSTQRIARDLLREGRAGVGHIVVADEQTDGWGRFGRAWASPRGGFYATLIVAHADLLAIRIGVAVARAVRSLGADVRLEWPNDLIAGGRKLGGILVETDGVVARLGVGINLLSSPVDGSTNLADLGAHAERDALLRAIESELADESSDESVLEAYRVLSATIGHLVRIDWGRGESTVGRAIDVDARGCLVVESERGREIVACGDCHHADLVPE